VGPFLAGTRAPATAHLALWKRTVDPPQQDPTGNTRARRRSCRRRRRPRPEAAAITCCPHQAGHPCSKAVAIAHDQGPIRLRVFAIQSLRKPASPADFFPSGGAALVCRPSQAMPTQILWPQNLVEGVC